MAIEIERLDSELAITLDRIEQRKRDIERWREENETDQERYQQILAVKTNWLATQKQTSSIEYQYEALGLADLGPTTRRGPAVKNVVADLLDNAGEDGLTAGEIIERSGRNGNTVRGYLSSALSDGVLVRDEDKRYRLR